MTSALRKTVSACTTAFVLALVCLLLPGCANQPGASGAAGTSGASADAGQGASQAVAYTDKDVPVVHLSGKDGTMTLRFYEDMPNVAYVSMTDFHAMLYPDATATASCDNGVWTITSPTGSATIDVDADTLRSDDLAAFANIVEDPTDESVERSLPCTKVTVVTSTPKTAPTSLDLAKYGIDLRADDEGAYLPFDLVASLHVNEDSMLRAAYNGKKVYVNDDVTNILIASKDEGYLAPLLDQLTRPDDLAAHSYAMWRFALENLYGYPGSEDVNETILREQGLEAALKEYGSVGDKILSMLQSTDMAEYLVATTALEAIFYDGHTYTALLHTNNINEENAPELYQAYTRAREKFLEDKDAAALLDAANDRTTTWWSTVDGIKAQRSATLGEGQVFTEGDTLLVTFDQFVCDNDAWNAYYASDKHDLDALLESDAAQTDTVMIFLNALRTAEADPAIKNVVVDLSNNLGGDTNALMVIMSLINNKSACRFHNVLNGQVTVFDYAVDRNFDCVFDERDAEVDYDYNFAVITSPISFSCANLMAAQIKDAGILVMGERSGGGTCALLPLTTSEGYEYVLSSYRMRLVNEADKSIDTGVPVDVDLLQYEADGSVKQTDVEGAVVGKNDELLDHYLMNDYSRFWDIPGLSDAINDYYALDQAA